ncbi:hypothetical protein [Nocardia xishanensis]
MGIETDRQTPSSTSELVGALDEAAARAGAAGVWGAPAPHYGHSHHHLHSSFGKMLFSS